MENDFFIDQSFESFTMTLMISITTDHTCVCMYDQYNVVVFIVYSWLLNVTTQKLWLDIDTNDSNYLYNMPHILAYIPIYIHTYVHTHT